MVFDDEQAKKGVDEPAPDDGDEDEQRRRRGSGTAAAAGAAGAGLGAGAAAGIVGGDDAVDFIRDQSDEDGGAEQSDLEEVQSRIDAARQAAEAVASGTTIDVFEDQVGEAGEELPAAVAEAAGIIGDALPPLPAIEDADEGTGPGLPTGPPTGVPTGRPEPEDLVPGGGDAPLPGGPPSIGRPDPAGGSEIESEAPDAPEPETDGEGPAPTPAAPGSPPPAPGVPAPPAAPGPPPGGPAPGSGEDDAVVGEAPAPPADPAPAGPGETPAPSPEPAPAPGSSESDDVVSEAPVVDGSPAPPSIPGTSEDDGPSDAPEPSVPGTSEEDPPVAPPSGSPGTSEDGPSPIDSEPSAPTTPEAPSTPSGPPAGPGASEPTPPPSGGPDAGPPSAPPSGPGESEPTPPPPGGATDSGGTPPGGPGPGSGGPGGGPGPQVSYPYVDEVDPDGEWANLWIETRNGDHLLVRYHVDGSTYYRDDDGDWVLIDDDRLPNLEAVDYGAQTAYFSKVQHDDTVYFKIDDDGDFDWIHEEDIPGYEPPYEEYEYPRVVEYEYGEDAWALIELENGQLIKYYEDGGAYRVDEDGNETAILGFEVPTLLDVDYDGKAWFRVFSETEGAYRFYYIDVDGGVEYVHEYEVPGYEPQEPEVDELYPPYDMPPYLEFGDNQYVDPEEADYQLILPSDPDEDTTHWQFRGPNGELIIVNKLDDYTYQYVWQPDPNVPPGTWEMVMNVTTDQYGYYQSHEAIDGAYYDEYYDEQPPVEENHPEYFFDEDYPNPLYGDLEPDGPPSFNGATGTYTQTYDNGQIIVTYQNEGGPYRIRWYDEDADGDSYLALDINYDAYNYTYDVYYYPYDYFNHVEDDFTIPEVDHYVDYAYLGIEPDEVDILGHQVQYIWYDEQGNISQLTRVDRATGEVSYQYGPLTIYVDANGNQTYAGTPDPNWAPPEGYEPPPIDENHEPYFFEDYPNPLYGDLEPDGPPSFNGATGTYTQTYDNGQIIVTYQDEDGPYRIRWYDQDEDGDNYLALDLNYDAENYEYDVYRYPIDYFDHVEDDFTLPAIDHYEDLAYLGVPPDEVDILDHQVQYIWYDEEGGYAQITRVDRATGEINYQYGPLFITVDQNGNQSYTGTPDPNWAPPEGYEPGPIQYDDDYIHDLLPDNLPPEFAGGFDNPEYNEEWSYSHSRFTEPDSEIAPVHFITNANGSYTIVLVENPNNTVSLYWYDRPVDEFGLTDLNDLEAHAFIQQNGNYNMSYYEDGVEVDPPVEEPVDENHPEYFFDNDYPNPFGDEDLDPDGPPSFNGATGTYTQTYDNGQIIVTYQDEDGPYRIRWYDQDENGDNYLALDLNYDAENYTYDVYRYPIDYFDHVEDDFTLQAIDHYEDLAYLGIPPDEVDILDHQVQYIWYDEEGGYAQITRVDRATGEIQYQYGPLFITVDQDGNQSYTGTPDPNWAPPGDQEPPPPVDENHEPYFFEDYPNPLYGDLEPDGPPSFNGATGTYTQTYDNGQVIVTYQNEGGPYRIRWYDQDEDGDNYLALDLNYDADNYEYDVYRYPIDYFDHVEDDFTLQAIDHYEDLAYLGIEPDEVDILDHQVQYIWYDEEGGYAQITRIDRATGEINYQYGPLFITVDQNGNQSYTGTPDPNWAPPGDQEQPPPVDENHEPYFLDNDYPNPLYGDLEADGPPSFNGATGTYTQTYDNGQVVVTYQQEGGPYRIQWFDQDAQGGNYVALDLTYNADNYTYDVHYYPYDYFDHVEDDFTAPGVEHYQDLAYLGIEPDEVDILGHQVQYIWYAEDGGYDQITRVDRATGEVTYQYGGLFISVDQNGNQSYTGTPDPNWAPPGGEAPPPPPPEDEYDAQYVYDLLPDNLPSEFEGGFANPEYGGGYQYHHSDEYGTGPTNHFFTNNGKTLVVVDHWDNTFTIYWYDQPIDEGVLGVDVLEAQARVLADGNYGMTYYENGEEVEAPSAFVAEEEEEAPLDIDGYLPDGTPAYFGDPMWANPEQDERFGQVQYNPDVDGTGTAYRAYRADLDQDGGAEYLINVWENPDGSARVEYYYMNELQATVDVITQPDGSYGTYNTTYEVNDYEGVPAPGEYEEEPPPPVGPQYYISNDYPNPNYLEPERVDGAWSYYNNNTIAVQDHGDGTETVMYGDGQGNFDMVFKRDAGTGEITEMIYWPDGGIGVEEEEEQAEQIGEFQAEEAASDEAEEAAGTGAEDAEAEELEFISDGELAEAEVVEVTPLEFNGPEVAEEEAQAEEAAEAEEIVEAIEIAQPELVETEPGEIASLITEGVEPLDDEELDDDDDDGSGL